MPLQQASLLLARCGCSCCTRVLLFVEHCRSSLFIPQLTSALTRCPELLLCSVINAARRYEHVRPLGSLHVSMGRRLEEQDMNASSLLAVCVALGKRVEYRHDRVETVKRRETG